MSNKIPKIIHQIWIGPNKPPRLWMKTFYVDYIKAFPDWEYKLWTEKEIEELNMANKKYYDEEFKLAIKCDMVRYEILNKYGGIFVDADSVWINGKNFEELTKQAEETGLFMGLEPDLGFGKIYAIGVIGSVPNHPLLKILIDDLPERYEKYRNAIARHTIAGPCYVTDTIKKYNFDKITVFHPIYFYPMFWGIIDDIHFHKKINLPPQSYTFQYGYSTCNLSKKINEAPDDEPPEYPKIPHQELEGYKFYSHFDSPGNDLIHFPHRTPEELKKICDQNDNYVGFNTTGWVKAKIVPENDMEYIPYIFKTNQGLYVKTSYKF